MPPRHPDGGVTGISDADEAREWCFTARYPLVIKADGLALGKGVVIAETPEESSGGHSPIDGGSPSSVNRGSRSSSKNFSRASSARFTR